MACVWGRGYLLVQQMTIERRGMFGKPVWEQLFLYFRLVTLGVQKLHFSFKI